MKKSNFKGREDIYKTYLITERVSLLLILEQEKLGLNQKQMSQKLDIPLSTYKRLINPNNDSIIGMENLAKIFTNSEISPSDVFDGVYK